MSERLANQDVDEINRRTFERHECSLPLKFHNGKQWLRGIATNISEGGLRVVTMMPAPVGNRLKLVFDELSGLENRLIGQVVWQTDQQDISQPGWIAPSMGIRFQHDMLSGFDTPTRLIASESALS